MSKNNSRHLAIGQNIGKNQRFVEQLTATQAIILSQSEKGKVPMVIDSRTTILVPKGADMEERRIHFFRTHENYL